MSKPIARLKNLPTDREVMRAIYDAYWADYPGNNYEDGVPGPNDPFVEIDIPALAKKMGCRPELLHGILYFHLNEKYSYETRKDVFVHIFEKKAGAKHNCVNFPYLASKLSSLEEEHRKVQVTRWLSIAAIIVSGLALGTRFFSAEI